MKEETNEMNASGKKKKKLKIVGIGCKVGLTRNRLGPFYIFRIHVLWNMLSLWNS